MTDTVKAFSEKVTKRYLSVSDTKETGATYTPPLLADFVALKILEEFEVGKKLDEISILDPATGDGELLLSMGMALRNQGFSNIRLSGFDTNSDAVEIARNRLREAFPQADIDIRCENFLEVAVKTFSQSDLFSEGSSEDFDIVIANPPYVRTQVIGAESAKVLAKEFNLKGRVDLYYPFILSFGYFLKENGVCGVITSNRFMTTNSGESVRTRLRELYQLLHVWDLGDTKIFDAAVLPAVMILRNKNPKVQNETGFSTIYESKDVDQTAILVGDVIEALSQSGHVKISDGRVFQVRHGRLSAPTNPGEVWRLADESSDKWLAQVNSATWGKFSDIGKIRVGVKTTADKVFIRDDWETVCADGVPELLHPLITHHEAKRFRSNKPSAPKRILYTHIAENGKRRAVNINDYPNARAYLESHFEQLEGRAYVKKAGRNWYEVWVPQNPESWPRPKLVMRDISEEPCFWIDLDGSVVNGDCYWLVSADGKEDLLWLALGVGNSKFIEKFYDHRFNNKLYSGRRRFITQYVKEFPVPDPSTASAKAIIATAKEAYYATDDTLVAEHQTKLDELVYKAFGVS